ncbi:choline kinase family protein [Clostridium sp. D43t1_170807_H7]|uniref:choline kinase family protein n=1 Tax=Clostridium sp. D43t1_170807_H7 TaxID=2787140 RepID=UPI00189BF7AD|nr:choline kinase family protein [Clostridium sp. D43t1_170807_H7]MEE0933176.1 choline kinase family protein [Clostridium sp.]
MNTTLIKFLKTELKWDIANLSSIKRIGGLSSENYKVSYKNSNYFVKICTHNYLHTDRKNELLIINKAIEVNIAPHLHYFSTQTGNIVSNWINGAIPSLTDFSSTKFLHKLSNSLKNFHSLKCEKYFNPFNHIRKRITICKNLNLPLPKSIDMLLKYLTSLEIKLNKNPLIGLCHNDLNASNIILSNDNLYFVDFEYSSMGDVFFDLATISWFFTEDSRKQLLILYFGEFKNEYYQKLLDYLFVVKFYNATWSLLKSSDSNSDYNYLAGAEMIFNDLLNYNSIRNF